MAKVIGGMTLSLDGFASDSRGDVRRLYPDLGNLRYTEMLQEEIRTTGAVVMGRNSYNMGDPDSFADNYEYQVARITLEKIRLFEAGARTDIWLRIVK